MQVESSTEATVVGHRQPTSWLSSFILGVGWEFKVLGEIEGGMYFCDSYLLAATLLSMHSLATKTLSLQLSMALLSSGL